MTVLVNGLGNIGSTLVYLLLHYKELFGIEKIYAIKNIPKEWEKNRYRSLEDRGVSILSWPQFLERKEEIDFIFDATANGVGSLNREAYSDCPNLKGAAAQGSEMEFGIPYMAGVNDSLVLNNPFITVVSCNTHGILSVLQYLGGRDFQNIESADFVIVRRSEDIGNHERLVSGNVVARHRSEWGTHHATDAVRLLSTIGQSLDLFSSDITTPSQFMHGMRFNVYLKNKPELNDETPLVGLTDFFDSNRVFEIGRREGFQGRLYNHSIIVSNNTIWKERSCAGWAFIPQEGNTILSTIKAFLIRTCPDRYERLFAQICRDMVIQRI